jgi:preprotein translocase subunit SecY
VSNEAFRPVRGIGTAAIILIVITVVADIVNTVADWTLGPVAAGDVEGSAGQAAAVAALLMLLWIWLVAYVLAGITFIVWMYWARLNSHATASRHQHKWAPMWVILGWIIPIVNLFVPQAVMQDIWRASDRSQGTLALQLRPKSGLVTAWWSCWIVSFALAYVGARLQTDQAVWSTLSTAVTVAAAVLAIQIIRKVNDAQHSVTEPAPAPAPGA